MPFFSGGSTLRTTQLISQNSLNLKDIKLGTWMDLRSVRKRSTHITTNSSINMEGVTSERMANREMIHLSKCLSLMLRAVWQWT
jgi:hypothetical protein